MPDQLLSCLRMLPLTESSEIFSRDCTGKSELFGQAALPLALDFTFPRPVVLLLGREFSGVIGLCLAGGKCLEIVSMAQIPR